MNNKTALKILIADDQKIIRDALKLILHQNETIEEIVEAHNGQMAIDIIKEKPVDIVLMDISMPIINGIDAAKTIKEKFPHVKIIIISMHMDSVDIAKVIEIGVEGYILKENANNSLNKSIHSIVNGNNYFSEEIKEIINR